jgi:ABC-type uncharacterized transport system permease subunit
MGQWVLGALMGLLSLVGLALASAAHEGTLYIVGLLLFALGVGFNYWLITRNIGHPTKQPDH